MASTSVVGLSGSTDRVQPMSKAANPRYCHPQLLLSVASFVNEHSCIPLFSVTDVWSGTSAVRRVAQQASFQPR